MQNLLIELLVRTSLLGAAIALLLQVLKIWSAEAQHRVWTAVLFVMLLLPAWLTWGPRAPLPVLRRAQTAAAASPRLPEMTAHAPAPAGATVATDLAHRSSGGNNPGWLTTLYLFGVVILLARLAVGTLRVRKILHQSVETGGRLTHESCASPVTVGWSHPAVILPSDWRVWPSAMLDAVLAHEEAHARRRDPLVQWIALLNRALFWFHPLAWWLERRRAALAEEACDVAVLERGHDPHDYSEYLLDLAAFVETTGTRVNAGAMAMPGAGLPQRIRRMLTEPPAPLISRAHMTYAALACAAAAAVLTTATMIHAQSKTGDLKFEVASIRRAQPGTGGGRGEARAGEKQKGGGGLLPRLNHGSFDLSATAFTFIVEAYGIQGCGMFGQNTECSNVIGGPDWMRTDRFDIQAKAPAGTPGYTFGQFQNDEAPEIQQMLKPLLTDRFNLKTHQEQRMLPVYVLTQTKKSPNLRPASGEMRKSRDGTMVKNIGILFMPVRKPDGDEDWTSMKMTVRNNSIREWANTMSSVLDRPVLDRTGLQGEFDMDTQFEADPPPPNSDATHGRTFSASFFSALNGQLGLKLEATKYHSTNSSIACRYPRRASGLERLLSTADRATSR